MTDAPKPPRLITVTLPGCAPVTVLDDTPDGQLGDLAIETALSRGGIAVVDVSVDEMPDHAIRFSQLILDGAERAAPPPAPPKPPPPPHDIVIVGRGQSAFLHGHPRAGDSFGAAVVGLHARPLSGATLSIPSHFDTRRSAPARQHDYKMNRQPKGWRPGHR